MVAGNVCNFDSKILPSCTVKIKELRLIFCEKRNACSQIMPLFRPSTLLIVYNNS